MTGLQAACDASSSTHSESDVNQIWSPWGTSWDQWSKQQPAFWLLCSSWVKAGVSQCVCHSWVKPKVNKATVNTDVEGHRVPCVRVFFLAACRLVHQ